LSGKQERRENYRWRVDIPTRWADGDPYGHVNNVIYYSWFDTAVTRMLFERGVIWLPDSPSIGLCVESKCEFLQSVTFPETIEAFVRIGRIGDKSLRFEVGLFKPGEESPAAIGYFVHVYVDRATRKPVSLTPAQREAVADLVVG
jgi:acyl-CoA thioester hydrolase